VAPPAAVGVAAPNRRRPEGRERSLPGSLIERGKKIGDTIRPEPCFPTPPAYDGGELLSRRAPPLYRRTRRRNAVTARLLACKQRFTSIRCRRRRAAGPARPRQRREFPANGIETSSSTSPLRRRQGTLPVRVRLLAATARPRPVRFRPRRGGGEQRPRHE